MRVAVLGSGMVGQALSAELESLGHEVRLGTREPEATKARDTAPWPGVPTFADWYARHGDIAVTTFAQAAEDADVIVVAVSGAHAEDALSTLREADLDGTLIVDVTNPMAPSESGANLTASDEDSIAERIQRAYPTSRVVKTLNTVAAPLMVDPASLADGAHTVFLSGDDEAAKASARGILEAFGWSHVVDLGDLSTARGVEQYMGLWLRLYALSGPLTNVQLVTA